MQKKSGTTCNAQGRAAHARAIARACVLVAASAVLPAALAGTAVGRISGSFDTTATGAAAYTIPINVAAGVNGLKPGIALVYNSQAADGLAGPGWTLTGLSEIARCGLVRALDGRTQGVRFIREDRYCLDGQPLVLVSGTHGSAGAEYRTEIHQFERVIAHGQQGSGPAWFEVRHPDGTVYRYGSDADSRIEAQGRTDVRAWALNEIVDKFEQRVGFAYAEDATGGEHVPVEIRWTYGAPGAFQQARHRLLFAWEPRPDAEVREGYLWGSRWRASKRLAAIDYQVNEGSGFARVHRYELAYTTPAADARSRLATVTQCGPTQCLAPTTMAWDGTSGERLREMYTGLSITQAAFGDFNGDGAADLFGSDGGRWAVWPADPENGGFKAPVTIGGTVTSTSTALTLDYNGDGLADLMTGSSQATNWIVYLAPATPGGTFAVRNTGVRWGGEEAEVVALDMDADGLDEVVYLRDGMVYVRRNIGGILLGEQASGMAPVAPGLAVRKGSSGYLEPADFDGDGRRDLLVMRSQPDGSTGLWEAFLSTGTGFGPHPIATLITGTNRTEAVVLDVNGDGLSDVLANERQTTGWQVRLSRGTADGQAPGLVVESCPDPLRFYPSIKIWPIDLNGDGRSELLTDYMGRTYRGDGRCFADGRYEQTPGIAGRRVFVVDADGDGLADAAYRSSDAGQWTVLRAASWLRPDGSAAVRGGLLREITDGLGNSFEITYRNASGWPGYRTTGGAVPATRLLRGAPIALVSGYRAGVGGADARFEITFEYADARIDTLGRGYFGFASIRSTDARSGLVTETAYRQDFPYAGRIGRTTVWNGPDRVSEKNATWSASVTTVPDPALDIHFVHLATEVTDAYEIDPDGGLAGQLVRSASRQLTWDFAHGAVAVEQLTVSSPQQPGVTFVTTRTAAFDEPLRDKGCPGRVKRLQVKREATGAATQTRTVRASYDQQTCRLVNRTEGSIDDPAQQLWTSFIYDSLGRVARTIAREAANELPPRQTAYTYAGDSGRPATEAQTISGEAEWVVSHTWDEGLGVETARTSPQGTTTTWYYDEFGRVRAEERPAGGTTFTYVACGPCFAPGARYALRQLRSDGYWSETQHDGLGRVVGRAFVLPDSRASRQLVEYDALGRVSRESVPYIQGDTIYWTRYTYDGLGRTKSIDRPLSAGSPSGAVTAFTYAGPSVSALDPGGRTSLRVHDADGRLTGVYEAGHLGAAYAYDAFGQLISVTDALGHRRELTWDERGRLTRHSDPDAGLRTFAYNAFGELVRQADGKSPANVTTWQYDQLGRVTSRTEPEGTTTWRYNAAGPARGLLQTVTGPSVSGPQGFRESYVYDGAGRLTRTTTVIDGSSYVTDYAFDAEGKLASMTYPQTIGWRPKFLFGYENGHLTTIAQESLAVTPIYALLGLDAEARETAARHGGGALQERNHYDRATGQLLGISSGPPSSPTAVQNYSYAWDTVGNLRMRRDFTVTPALDERFHYDTLNRLTRITLNGVETLRMTYAPDGNILSKSDVGNFTYAGPAPHAVTSFSGGPRGAQAFAYDANGNMTRRSGAVIGWTSFNLPRTISGSYSARFTYGPGRSRIREDSLTGSTARTIHRVGPHFEVEIEGDVRRYRSNVFAYGRAVYSQVETTPNGLAAYHVLHDHAGSVDRLVRAAGTGADRLSLAFDAWGKRRNTNWTADPADQRLQDSHWTERGYTGHEHLDGARLVHMNGRLHDPLLGRMISPDPLPGALGNPQLLNPYTYALNNPASYYDPSGFFLSKLRSFLKRAVRHAGSFGRRVVRRWGRTVAAVGTGWLAAHSVSSWAYSAGIGAQPVTVSLGGELLAEGGIAAGTLTATMPTGAVLAGIAGGAASGAVSSGNLKGAAAGAVSGGLLTGLGGVYGSSYDVGRVLAEGAVSGAVSAVHGGSFMDGFLTGAGVSSITWASLEMRRAMIEQSRIRYDMAEPLYARDNAGGVSVGFRGDGFKLGGCRHPCAGSPLGGIQGGPGNVFAVAYGPGSFLDRLVETYAGPHDFLNSGLFYDAWGNNRPRPDFFEIVNAANVLVATPFAAASAVPGYTYGALTD